MECTEYIIDYRLYYLNLSVSEDNIKHSYRKMHVLTCPLFFFFLVEFPTQLVSSLCALTNTLPTTVPQIFSYLS